MIITLTSYWWSKIVWAYEMFVTQPEKLAHIIARRWCFRESLTCFCCCCYHRQWKKFSRECILRPCPHGNSTGTLIIFSRSKKNGRKRFVLCGPVKRLNYYYASHWTIKLQNTRRMQILCWPFTSSIPVETRPWEWICLTSRKRPTQTQLSMKL